MIVLHWRIARNFDWEGPKIEKSCNLSLVIGFMTKSNFKKSIMTSLEMTS